MGFGPKDYAWWHVMSSSGFSAEYQTVYDSFTTKPSTVVADADNTMVQTLADVGLWSTKLDIFDVFAMESNGDGESLKNWINPGTFNPTLVNAPSFVSLEGFTGNGSTSYINLNYNPVTDGTNYSQDSFCLGAYIRNNITRSHMAFGVRGASVYNVLLPRYTDDNVYAKLNSNTYTIKVGQTDSRGMYVLNRPDSATQQIYINKVKTESAVASTGLPSYNIYGLGYNYEDTPTSLCNLQESLIFAGGSLTQADVTTITDAFETRMDTLGKGVIA